MLLIAYYAYYYAGMIGRSLQDNRHNFRIIEGLQEYLVELRSSSLLDQLEERVKLHIAVIIRLK